jgi:murein DD-endopeptidase MepM/ murein hydrolase activator NlpD
MSIQDVAVTATSPLYSTSIKKRMVMMTKKQTSNYKLVVYSVLIPASAILIISFGKSQNTFTPRVEQGVAQNRIENIPDIAPVDLSKVTKVVLYGERMHPAYNELRLHAGIDFELREGSDVVATADGVVEFSRYGDNYGNYVRIKHSDNYSTQYSHLKLAMVKGGAKITKGQVIGYIGNTGLSTTPHLHYEILKGGKMVDPKDYLPQLPGL